MIVVHQIPTVQEYCQMRAVAGLSPKSENAAARGLPNSLFGVSVRDPYGNLLAMGRLVGDGGCFVQVCDIAVHPDHQGKGLGRRVMQELMDYIDQNLPTGAFINLFADGTANELYKKFGFHETAPKSVGMAKYAQ
jgi:ribosomal protein S18 acetylase RimI-like enzyme